MRTKWPKSHKSYKSLVTDVDFRGLTACIVLIRVVPRIDYPYLLHGPKLEFPDLHVSSFKRRLRLAAEIGCPNYDACITV